MRAHTRPSLIIGSLLLGACLLAACDEPKATQTPTFNNRPEAFVFPPLGAGATAQRRVEIFNEGTGDLAVRNLRLEEAEGDFTLFLEAEGELVEPPPLLEIPGGDLEPRVLVVQYDPSNEGAEPNAVLAETNDTDNLEVSIPVNVGGAGAEIRVSPRTIDFGEVEAGATGREDLTISNIGVGELAITHLSVNGSGDFGAELDGRDLLGDLGEPVILAPGDTITVQALYSPPLPGPDSGELQIESSDPNAPVTTVNLRANGAAPCLQVTPDSVDFGSRVLAPDREMPTPNRSPVGLQSCGTTPLRITAIEIEDAAGAYAVVDLPEVDEGEPLFELPAADFENAVFPTEQIEVGFWPAELQAYGGRMLVHSNDPTSPTAVDLFGRGVDNACPIPAVVSDRFEVQPLEIITLDGSPSMDPGGTVAAWSWTVVSRPDGSVSIPVESFTNARRPADGGPEDDTSTPQAQFFVDLAGEYELELRVTDNLGQPSCDPIAVKRVAISAIPEKDLHIQLVWTTPGDPDETDDTGTDVDLHFRHENAAGGWGADADVNGIGYDCYFRQQSPDWGLAGEVRDNPTLDIDDTNGAGPENVNLDEPEVGVTYDVGAVYFRAESTFGLADADPRMEHESLVTVRIFVRGELLAEFVDKPLNKISQLWHVARVTWCEDFARCPMVEPVDQVLDEADWRRL